MPPAHSIAKLCQPAATPHPRSEDRVDDAADKDAEDEEALEAPALRTGTGHDGRRGVHEDHHEEEEHDGRRVVAGATQEEARRSKEPPSMVAIHGRADSEHVIERRHAAEAGGTANRRAVHAAAHEREAAHEEAEHA